MKKILFPLSILLSTLGFSQSDLVVVSSSQYHIIYRNVPNLVQLAFDGMNDTPYRLLGYGCYLANIDNQGDTLPQHNVIITTGDFDRQDAILKIVRFNGTIYNDTIAEIHFFVRKLPDPILYLGGTGPNSYCALKETMLFAKYDHSIFLNNQFKLISWEATFGKKKYQGIGNKLSQDYLNALKKLKENKTFTITAKIIGEDNIERTISASYLKPLDEWSKILEEEMIEE